MQLVITLIANEGDRASHYYWVAATDQYSVSQSYKSKNTIKKAI